MSTLLAMLALAFVAVSPTTAQSEIWDGSGSGAHVWTFAGSNPIGRTDPLGLYGWDDDIDDLIADRTGHALYTIGTLNEGARWASIGLSTALDIAGSLLPGSGLYQAFQSVTVLASGGGGFWAALDIATAAFPVVQKGAHAIGGLKSLFKARKWKRLSCGNSFVEGTQVDTPAGPVSIEELKAGTWVLSRPQNDPSAEPGLALVTAVTCSDAPAVLWVTLSKGVLLGMTPEHELWTRQDGWTTAAVLQEGDELLDREGRAVAVVAVALDRTPTTAWNLTVAGTETYFVDGVWVHNGECHHLIPKFMGGWLNEALYRLPTQWHHEFHRSLRENLRLANIELPENAGRQAWDMLLQDPELFERAREALLFTTEQFDRARGTSMLPRLLDEMRRQFWL